MSREANGAAWLDAKLPTWFKRVKDPVNIAGYHSCIGGQIDGDFYTFCTKRDLTVEQAIKLGFQFRKIVPTPQELEGANRRWQEQVDTRQRAAVKRKVEVVA